MTGQTQEPPERSIAFAAHRLDLATQRLWSGLEPVAVRPKSWQVLLYLAQRPGILVSIDELLDAAWPGTAVTPSVLTNVIGELRRVLGDRTSPPHIIETVHRRGYRFIARVESDRAAEGRGAPAEEEGIFIGRAAEMQRLLSCWDRALHGKRQVVFVGGEAGVGKTTLVNACTTRCAGIDAGARVARVPCREQLSGREALLPLIELVEQLAAGRDREEFVGWLRQYAPTWLVQISWLLAAEEMQTLRHSLVGSGPERMLREGAALFEAAAAAAPLLLVIEDLHWADPATLDVIAALAQRSNPARLLLVGTYRPVDAVVRGHPVARMARALCQHQQASEIVLAPFAGGEVREYLMRRLGDDALAGQLATRMEHQSGGNPLFLGALATHLVAQGWVDIHDGRWVHSVDVRTHDLGLPQDVRAAIEAQLAQLPPLSVALLEAASVEGEEFSAATVAAGLDCPVTQVEDRCHELASYAHLVRPSPDAPRRHGPEDRPYRFVHALYWRALYDRVAPSRRRLLHQRIGECLERTYGDRSAEFAGQLASHFQAAGDVPRRIHYQELAALAAASRFAHDEAVQHLTDVVTQLQRLPVTRERHCHEARLHLSLGNMLGVGHGFGDPRVRAAFERAEALAGAAEAHRERFRSLLGLAPIACAGGSVADLEPIVEQQLAMVRSVVPELTGQAYWRSGELQLAKGEFRTARQHLEHSLEAEGEPGIPVVFDFRSVAEAELGAALTALGFLDQARQARDRGVRRSEAAGLPFGRCNTMWLASVVSLLQRDYDGAVACAAQSAAMAERFGFPAFRAVFTFQGDCTLAQQSRRRLGTARDIQRALDENHAVAGRWFDTLIFLQVAGASLAAGACASALAWIDKACADVEQLGQRWLEAELYRMKGECLLALEQPQARGRKSKVRRIASAASANAETCLRRAIGSAQQQQAKLWELRATISLARLLERRGRASEGHALLSHVFSWFTEGFDGTDLVEARALLQHLAHAGESAGPKR